MESTRLAVERLSSQTVISPEKVSSPRSWHPLWKVVPFLVLGFVSFGFRAADENDAANRQQRTFGTITDCEQRGKEYDNSCHYTFSVGDDQYVGVNRAAREDGFGQIVYVYYDDRDPRVNALKDYSAQSRTDRRWAYVLLLALAAVITGIFWAGKPRRGF